MASVALYQLLERNGYRNLRGFVGSLQEWQQAGYPLEGAMMDAQSDTPRDLSSLDAPHARHDNTRSSARWSPARTGAGGTLSRSPSSFDTRH